jgi:two-component system, OmpR family, sensor kinase
VSLRTTIVAAIAYVLVLAIVVLEVPLVINLSRRVDAEVKAEAAGQAQIVAATAGDLAGEPPKRVQPLVETAARQLGGRVIVLDRRGRVVVDSAGPGLRGVSYADRPEVETALGPTGRTAQGERHSESLGDDLLFTAVPVLAAGRPAGAVRVTQSVTAVNAEVRSDAIGLIGVGVAALMLGLGVAWVLAGFLARPPRSLAEAARRVAAGDLEARAPESGPREQREVAHAFNDMTARLASALRAQRDFVANASHQLRTPLTGLRLRLEAAADGTRDRAIVADLRAAEDEVVRLSRLIDNLLQLAREGQEGADARPVAMAAAIRAAAGRWEAEASARRQRLSVVDRGDERALASPEDLEIVLDNLLENAIKYSPPGSTVTIESDRPEAGRVLLAVSDEGPGLGPGEERAALERFRRGSAAARTPGTGLGLAIVEVLVRRWRGSIELGNRPRGGLRAEVRLPAAEADSPGLDEDLDRSLPGAL